MSIRGAPQCEAGEKDNEKRLDEKTCAGRRAALAARWVEEEGRPGYTPPRGTWLDPTPRSAIPGLKRRLTDECRPGSDSADSADVARKLQARSDAGEEAAQGLLVASTRDTAAPAAASGGVDVATADASAAENAGGGTEARLAASVIESAGRAAR